MQKLKESLTPLTRNIIIFILLLLLVSVGGMVYFYFKSKEFSKSTASVNELEEIVEKVSKLLVLPADETPTMATVSDPEKLKDQPFFAKAKTGDKVLIYSNSKKAILYSPTLNKIIEVAPINTSVNTNQIGN